MAKISAIADTGFVVGALDVADQWHAWAAQQFPAIGSPALTCEAVISEACFQLRQSLQARSRLLAWVKCGGLQVHPLLPGEIEPIEHLFDRYGKRMDYADACLVRLSDLDAFSRVLHETTVDCRDRPDKPAQRKRFRPAWPVQGRDLKIRVETYDSFGETRLRLRFADWKRQ